MFALLSLLTLLGISFIVVRIATVALVVTGLSRESARFQARSALTGTGFTTTESESVVNHPIRRRIIMILMIVRNAGIITGITSLLLSFLSTQSAEEKLYRFSLILTGVLSLWFISMSKWVDQKLESIIAWALEKWTYLEIQDYAGLLHLSDNYTVMELFIEKDDWIANKKLAQSKLSDEGILVLGIQRKNGKYIGTPRGETNIYAEDTLILYGRKHALHSLSQRKSDFFGEQEHETAVEEQQSVLQEQEKEE